MIYAPIIIPTLNRIEHLKRCIRSLQNNAWAKNAPLIISVDYPPEEKYVSGYKKICEYLEAGIDGFQSVDIIYQQSNLGAYGNEEYLQDYVKKKYDRYIFLEDDIEVSPNFLEYINKGLMIFENNEDIFAICASGIRGQQKSKTNIMLTQNFSAHGYGTWIHKREECISKLNRCYIERVAKKGSALIKLAWMDPELIYAIQSAIFRKERLYQLPDGEIPIIDQMIKIYLISEGKYAVAPLMPKSRNWGYDGSGVNCLRDENYDATNEKIDISNRFEYIDSYPWEKENVSKRYSLETICRILVAFFKLWLWKIKIYKKDI